MKKSSIDPVLALEAKMIVALALRNGPDRGSARGKALSDMQCRQRLFPHLR